MVETPDVLNAAPQATPTPSTAPAATAMAAASTAMADAATAMADAGKKTTERPSLLTRLEAMGLADRTQPLLLSRGGVSGLLVSLVAGSVIIGYWREHTWELPPIMDGLLAAAWGYLMSLEATSSLKAFWVVAMVINVLALVLLGGSKWAAPVLCTLAVQGFTQYVVQRRGDSASAGVADAAASAATSAASAASSAASAASAAKP
jgi:hypothetical protein